ncbi:hypothetical protein Rcae01_00754 [Novipirellula caenicola]|uniref:Transposase IS701-like DDE domain-containing protein n=1 Tax=Novipirellula caenicola TaxID=1536901 RepID=A0ABP9VM08_9BACT
MRQCIVGQLSKLIPLSVDVTFFGNCGCSRRGEHTLGALTAWKAVRQSIVGQLFKRRPLAVDVTFFGDRGYSRSGDHTPSPLTAWKAVRQTIVGQLSKLIPRSVDVTLFWRQRILSRRRSHPKPANGLESRATMFCRSRLGRQCHVDDLDELSAGAATRPLLQLELRRPSTVAHPGPPSGRDDS